MGFTVRCFVGLQWNIPLLLCGSDNLCSKECHSEVYNIIIFMCAAFWFKVKCSQECYSKVTCYSNIVLCGSCVVSSGAYTLQLHDCNRWSEVSLLTQGSH